MCFLFYIGMTTEKQILKILKEENIPLKAREISSKFPLYFNESISKHEVNKIIHKDLKLEVVSSGFPRYTHSLIKQKDLKVGLVESNDEALHNSMNNIQEVIDFDKDFTQNIQVSKNDEIKKIIDLYVIDFKIFRNKKKLDLRSKCLENLERIVDFIINNNIDIIEIAEHLVNEKLILQQIFNNDRIESYVLNRKSKLDLKITNFNVLPKVLEKLIYEYENCNIDYHVLTRKPKNIQLNFQKLINNLKIKVDNYYIEIIEFIISEEIQLIDLESNSPSKLYKKILNDNDIHVWLNPDSNDIDEINHQDRIKQFRETCKRVWSDGVITTEEHSFLVNEIVRLNIDSNVADEILNEEKLKFIKAPNNLDESNLNWSFEFDDDLESYVKINYFNKSISFKNSHNMSREELLVMFVNNLLNERSKHRSPEVDLFFENFEEFYNE